MLAARTVTPFQEYIHLSRYSRYLHDEKRRETWPETVARYFDFFEGHLKKTCSYTLTPELRKELEDGVLNMEVMPSMRCLMTAGPALERDHMAAYNCAFVAVDSPKTFSEMLYVLMCGTGVGFSVERQFVNKLPEVPEELVESDVVITVADSKIGWARGLQELVHLLYAGSIPKWDASKVRPAGAILKTFGGRASGPEPLNNLFKQVVQTFKEARGRKLTSLECHDLACMIGDAVVVGGVRRSALISLSNLSDDRMRGAKTGQWWSLTPHRRLANNSAVYEDERPEMSTFITEWKSLYDSKSGERGIFSRWAAKNVIRRSNEFRTRVLGEAARLRDVDHEFGCNPCSEVILRPTGGLCNLTETVIRAGDTPDDICRKARLAAILGTFQSTLVDFRFVGKRWRNNAEDERLLGVSMTGIMDNAITNGSNGEKRLKEVLTAARRIVIETNEKLASELGIQASVASTVVKPSGTVSSLVNSAAGVHPRHSRYYIRAVRSDKKDPLAQLMIDQGVPYENDLMSPDHTYVFYFPVESPEGSVYRDEVDAIRQLEIWKLYQLYWCDHKPSITVSVRESEWMRVGSWVYDNFEWMSGVSFLPTADHVYKQAPYQEVSAEDYAAFVEKFPKTIDWSKLIDYEKEDATTGSQELACVAGGCDL